MILSININQRVFNFRRHPRCELGPHSSKMVNVDFKDLTQISCCL